jgi:hypothetical protein
LLHELPIEFRTVSQRSMMTLQRQNEAPMRATKFETYINLKTAKALGISAPVSSLAVVGEVLSSPSRNDAAGDQVLLGSGFVDRG